MPERAPAAALPCVLDLAAAELAALLAATGADAYRAGQVRQWVYQRHALTFSEMTDLPAPLRSALARRLRIAPAEIVAEQDSADGSTHKALLRLDDGELVETVLMRYAPFRGRRARRTVCVSTQAGCGMGCIFCATGAQGYRRQLRAAEILVQVQVMARRALAEGFPLTHVVFMGMGEPLANYAATHAALTRLTDAEGFGWSPRRITVSTVGVAPGIRRLARDHPQVNLAISLHAPTDALRRELVPVPGATVAEIIAAAREHSEITGRRVTVEYVLLAGVNDQPLQARELARRLGGLRCHVNLIPLNPSAEVVGVRPDRSAVLAFQAALEAGGIPTTIRVEKGGDIAAACGQLRGDRLRQSG